MINIALEQEQRYLDGLSAFNAEIDKQTDSHDVGFSDGIINCFPKTIEPSYWSGYEVGLRQYWAQRLEIKIPIAYQIALSRPN